MTDLPTIEEYKRVIDTHVSHETLTVDQGIILLTVFKNHLEGLQTHVNQLMSNTGLNWKNINWVLNGLVQRNAIRKNEKYYTL